MSSPASSSVRAKLSSVRSLRTGSDQGEERETRAKNCMAGERENPLRSYTRWPQAACFVHFRTEGRSKSRDGSRGPLAGAAGSALARVLRIVGTRGELSHPNRNSEEEPDEAVSQVLGWNTGLRGPGRGRIRPVQAGRRYDSAPARVRSFRPGPRSLTRGRHVGEFADPDPGAARDAELAPACLQGRHTEQRLGAFGRERGHRQRGRGRSP